MTEKEALDKQVWLFIYQGIVENLNSDNCKDAYMLSRAMEQVSEHFKGRFSEYPETGEPCFKSKKTGEYYPRNNTIVDDVLHATEFNQSKLASKLKPPVSKSTMCKWRNGGDIPAKRIEELKSLLVNE